jgi:hypothetical protein
MIRELRFTAGAKETLAGLEADPSRGAVLAQVRKTLGLMETDLRHPSLRTHEYRSLSRPAGDKVFEAYVQNQTPAAFRIFFVYGPDRQEGPLRIPVLTVIAITPHP